MRASTILLLVAVICFAGVEQANAQRRVQTTEASGGGGGLCNEACVYISNPFGSGWGCRTMNGLGQGYSCYATTDICMILIPSTGCPMALLEPVFRTGEQFVQFCAPKDPPSASS